MKFIKKHYEMVLLGAVLVGLVVAVVLLVLRIESEKNDMEQMRNKILAVKVKPLDPLDLARLEAAIKMPQSALELNFTAPPHNLVNPVPWQKAADNNLIPLRTGKEVGLDRLEVTKVSKLYLTVGVESIGASGSNFLIRVERETDVRNRSRSKYLAPGDRLEPIVLRSAKLAADTPLALGIERMDTGERATISTNNPYRAVDGYTLDLKYDLENKRWSAQRRDSKLTFNNDEFTIVAINLVASNQFEVVLSAKSTGKKKTIKFNAAP